MNNLKEEIAKIHNFVNAEFDIEDNSQVEAIKEGLSLDKIDILDKMLNDYKKSVSAIRRKEQLRQNAKKYKKIGTNLKLEEFAEYENDAKSKNMNISEYVKSALISFKKPEVIQIPIPKQLDPFKGKYEAIQNDLFVMKKELEAEKSKSQKYALEKVKLLEDKKKLEQCRTKYIEQKKELEIFKEKQEQENQKFLNKVAILFKVVLYPIEFYYFLKSKITRKKD